MAENLMGLASSNGPYVHSSIYHFRSEVGTSLQQIKSTEQQVDQVVNNLSSLSSQLKTAADSFLIDWEGDYKKASRQLFFSDDDDNQQARFRKIAIEVLNTVKFIEIIQRNFTRDYGINIRPLLQKYGIDKLNESLKDDDDVQTFVKKIMQQFFRNVKNNTRVDLTGDKKAFIRELLGDMQRKFAQSKESLAKQLTQEIKKKSKKLDGEKIYAMFYDDFLAKINQNEMDSAKSFLQKIKPSFLRRLNQITTIDYSNITGEIGENLTIAVVEDNEMQFSFFEVGDMTEDKLMQQLPKFAQQVGADINQIIKVQKGNTSAQKSGTDWIISNSKGMMVRAQVKNSTKMAEELRQKGAIGFPQTVKIQDNIYYKTLKYNLQTYNRLSNLSPTDWVNLEYLIANTVWFSARGSDSRDKGSDYTSNLSGIRDLINNIFSKEVGYFLGIAMGSAEKGVQAVIGASNIFFVLDSTLLYPTYRIVDGIISQLQNLRGALSRLQVSLGNNFSGPTKKALNDKKEEARTKDGPWRPGQSYGSNILKVGREAGNQIINTLQIDRINLKIDIDTILADCFNRQIIT